MTLRVLTWFLVPFYRCEMCGEEKHCDGKDANLLHMGDYAVFHALLKDYLKLFLGEGYVCFYLIIYSCYSPFLQT